MPSRPSRATLAMLAAALIATPVRAQTLPKADDVVQRHVAAQGGEAATSRIQSRSVWARYEDVARQRRGTVLIFAARPNKRIVKIEYPDVGTEVTGFDGTTGWSIKPGVPPRLVTGAELAELRDESEFDITSGSDDLVSSRETVDVAQFEGRPCVRVRVVSTTHRVWFEYFDVASGLFAGRQSQHATPKGPITVTLVVSDYRRQDGVLVPFHLELRSAGSEETVTVVRVEDNSVPASAFEVPRRLR